MYVGSSDWQEERYDIKYLQIGGCEAANYQESCTSTFMVCSASCSFINCIQLSLIENINLTHAVLIDWKLTNLYVIILNIPLCGKLKTEHMKLKLYLLWCLEKHSILREGKMTPKNSWNQKTEKSTRNEHHESQEWMSKPAF